MRGQVTTDSEGRFEIETIKPGNYENGPGAWRPAHVRMMFHRDGQDALATQIYFAGDPYLAPNDGCSSCGSDDQNRIVALGANDQGILEGELRIVL